MEIIITDYPKVLNRNLDYEIELMLKNLPKAHIRVVEYLDEKEWFSEIQDADAILTAFIKIDAELMDRLPNLKYVSVNASGYGNVDVKEAAKRNIAVAAIQEYCTQEVADHTMMLLLALSRKVKHYIHDIDINGEWKYSSVTGIRRLEGRTLGICGFGKIGRAVAKRAKAFGLKVIAYSPSISKEQAQIYGIETVDKETLLRESDIITNHMPQSDRNYHFFDEAAFRKMEKQPIFINVGRGSAVDEAALQKALDEGYISAAGLDVLEDENPMLKENGLTGRENVIITPHAAFYSEDSIKALQDISCMNLVHMIKGEYEQVRSIVS